MLRGPSGVVGPEVQRCGIARQPGAIPLGSLVGLPGLRCGIQIGRLSTGNGGVDVGRGQLGEGKLVGGDLGVQLRLAGIQRGTSGFRVGGGLIGGLLRRVGLILAGLGRDPGIVGDLTGGQRAGQGRLLVGSNLTERTGLIQVVLR